MITLFDLREKQNGEIHDAIERIFNNSTEAFQLQSVKACIGCWSCWLKTPGRCVIKDKMGEIYSNYVNSDTVVLLMDTAQGFISHQAKAFLDRTIPHYHPYIEMIGVECHHVARYERYPDMVFYYDTAGLTSQEDQVIEDYLYRTGYHFKSRGYRLVWDGDLNLRPLQAREPKNQNVPLASTEPMEKLVIYNGSPRRSGSNSSLILSKVAEALDGKVDIRDLKQGEKWAEWADAFISEEHVMFFMPLYVHAMPSHVMAFLEKLQPSEGSISFFVQSGFPESSQSHYLEAYFEQLALRLGRIYLGTAIKGGVEGLQMRPAKAQDSMVKPMVQSVMNLVNDGKFNPTDIRQLGLPVRFGKFMELPFNLVGKPLINRFMWDRQLKANGAYENRFDRPYWTSCGGVRQHDNI